MHLSKRLLAHSLLPENGRLPQLWMRRGLRFLLKRLLLSERLLPHSQYRMLLLSSKSLARFGLWLREHRPCGGGPQMHQPIGPPLVRLSKCPYPRHGLLLPKSPRSSGML